MTGTDGYTLHVYDRDTLHQECPNVADAIRMWVQVVEKFRAEGAGLTPPPDVDTRYLRGWVDGVARSMATMDGWCQDHADSILWAEVARANGAGPAHGTQFAYARGAAWRAYIHRAADDLARTFMPSTIGSEQGTVTP